MNPTTWYQQYHQNMMSSYHLNQNQIILHNVLVENIRQLSSHTIEEKNNLLYAVDRQNTELNQMAIENDQLKRKVQQLKNENAAVITQLKQVRDNATNDLQTESSNKKRKLTIYLKSQQSFEKPKITAIMENIKTIDDIIGLEKYQHDQIRHNLKLHKLYGIIEPLKKLKAMVGLDTNVGEIRRVF